MRSSKTNWDKHAHHARPSNSVRYYKPYTRACFKIAFWQLCVPVCGRFVPDEGRIAGYVT
ncbi:DUF6783 domain-containing protein [uncultured Robinsoniella sp.]|uniref:DUF6783 domain-containing protein n=1 Tax=uncultured Robinsoniella sp. TaxID=904190 RepID=UPI00374E3929